MTAEGKEKEEIKFPQLSKPYPPELEAYAVLNLVVKLSDDKKDKQKALDTGALNSMFVEKSLGVLECWELQDLPGSEAMICLKLPCELSRKDEGNKGDGYVNPKLAPRTPPAPSSCG